MDGSAFKAVAALLGTTLLWGSSFPAIKVVMESINEYRYTWIRALVALVALLPYLAYAHGRGRIDPLTVKGGLLAGVAYSLGIWLQGWGMKFTTASNAAFITGLNAAFVHAYQALIEREYGVRLGASLVLGMVGLYLLTAPRGGLSFGDALVLLSALAWASQVIVVGRYCRGDPLVFTFFEFLPSIAFALPDLSVHGKPEVPPQVLVLLVYLGVVCGDAAFALQVYGQRNVRPAAAALVFLLEPVIAAILAFMLLGEMFTAVQVVGALLILASMLAAVRG